MEVRGKRDESVDS
jgi:hypothetical protein